MNPIVDRFWSVERNRLLTLCDEHNGRIPFWKQTAESDYTLYVVLACVVTAIYVAVLWNRDPLDDDHRIWPFVAASTLAFVTIDYWIFQGMRSRARFLVDTERLSIELLVGFKRRSVPLAKVA